MLEQVLQDYGLSAKESKLYLICLELGNAPVSSIARRLGENRVTTYSNLKNLVKRGIATEVTKQNTTYYSAISAQQLFQKMEQKCETFKKTLPAFMSIEGKSTTRPKIQFFDGVEGIKQLYEDVLLSEKSTIYAFLGMGAISPQISSYLNLHFLPKRVKMGVCAKVLLCNEESIKLYPPYAQSSNKQLTEIRIVPFDFVKFVNEINIYGQNKVCFMMFSQEEASGVIIQSKQLHDTMKSIFDLAWFVAKKPGDHSAKKTNQQKSSLKKKKK